MAMKSLQARERASEYFFRVHLDDSKMIDDPKDPAPLIVDPDNSQSKIPDPDYARRQIPDPEWVREYAFGKMDQPTKVDTGDPAPAGKKRQIPDKSKAPRPIPFAEDGKNSSIMKELRLAAQADLAQLNAAAAREAGEGETILSLEGKAL